ncbi:hypothetical protein BN1708_005414 [Verticillium longisporum]|uniref:BTB domain-containing protein n=1 Tax=Verticillium longisporum TaxID=100787 RepID=A0A0G4MBV0_VERLO|nr:hypothetical protein BN1708_005414 [Verticillium longisporum]
MRICRKCLANPFLTEARSLCFASQTKYHVHRGLLNTFEEVNSLSIEPWSNAINFKDVPEGVGRVFIDYLYSGLCQLSVAEKPQNGEAKSPHILETSLRVYCFALQYRVEELVRIVKEQITQLARSCRPMTLLEAAKRACNSVSKEDAWLQELVRSHSCLLLRQSEPIDQDAMYRLLSPSDNLVSQTLLRELLLCCRANADTPAASTLGDEDPLGRSCELVDTFGSSGNSESPATHPAEALEPEPVPADDSLPEAEPAPAEEPWAEAEPVPVDDSLSDAPAEEPWAEAEPVPADDPILVSEPAPELLPVGSISSGAHSLLVRRKKKKRTEDALEQQQKCLQRSEHLCVDMGWLRCDICRAEVVTWSKFAA